jgi:hypothetical protein
LPITEVKKERIIIIHNKWKIGGCIIKRKCDICGAFMGYFDKYDMEFCPECNSWAREKCGDIDCPYCAKRPETPLHEFY